MQKKVQDAIKTLLAVSEMTSQYLNEGRLDGDREQELVQLSHECRNHLAELRNIGQEFETMDTQKFRQNDVRKLTESLEAKVKGLEDINSRVNVSVLHLEKALRKYITQVKDGEYASSIISSISSSSTASTISQKNWRLIQKELESVGITAAQFTANREKVLNILSDAFQEDAAEDSSIRIKKAGQLTRLLSPLSSKSRDLLAAAEKGHTRVAKILLTKGAYIDTRDAKGFTPLLLAVKKQNLELTDLFLSYKADVNKRAKSYHMSMSPLIYAVDQRNVEIINLLLDHGANVNQPNLEQMTPLHIAVGHKDIDIINTLLDRGADVSAESSKIPPTALGMAIDQVSFDIIKTLVKHRCDVNQAFWRKTPISLAIKKGDLNIIQYLMQNNAHVDTGTLQTAVEMQNIEQFRLLLTHQEKAGGPKANLSTLALAASRVGNEDALRLLLERGVDVNASTSLEYLRVRYYDGDYLRHEHRIVEAGGETLVWLAAAGGHLRSLNLLLGKGADIEKRAYPKACTEHTLEDCLFAEKRVEECTAVQIAVSHSHWDCARLLVRHGGDLNAWVDCFQGESERLLHLAINAPVGPTEILRNLADIGADLNIENYGSRTPLHVLPSTATSRGNKISMARTLIAKGGEINHKDDWGVTPLHCAVGVKSRDYELIEFLLKNGADPNAKDKNDQTPLHYAAELADQRVFRTLIKAGGKADRKDNEGRSPQSRYDDFRGDLRPSCIVES
ncbi:MAG: hypothetical protein L6R38_009035 [Xanthoria sp. 2 TBL-2021]|nr:MAG: hypothetical protein L6R38_009035 [Xanthoria sp. 2 TBL-2021]